MNQVTVFTGSNAELSLPELHDMALCYLDAGGRLAPQFEATSRLY